MQPITFCNRCRGMKVGWNGRYIEHCLICRGLISRSAKLLILTVSLAFLIFSFPTRGSFVLSVDGSNLPAKEISTQRPGLASMDPAIRSIEAFLKSFGAEQVHLARVASSIVKSAKKHNLDARLIASIVIVESRANPFAISSANSIGVMQIHLPTWGRTAEREGLNLFKIEDNIDLGCRILRDYVAQSGLWAGVKRYKGWFAGNPDSSNSAERYVSKVQRIYGYRAPVAVTSDLLQ